MHPSLAVITVVLKVAVALLVPTLLCLLADRMLRVKGSD